MIVGQGFEFRDGKIVNYFSYYDNATSNRIHGTNLLENRLYQVNDADGNVRYEDRSNIIINITRNGAPAPDILYRLTEIR